jgi:small subunit ribosomal protein S5
MSAMFGQNRSQRGRRPENRDSADREFDQKIIELARVTRVMAGGKRMRFRACVVIGDRKGQVGAGVAKGADVTLAISKAVADAKKHMIRIPIFEDTIPHQIRVKYGAADVLMKPAPRGSGVIAGGAIRSVLDLGGVPNIVSKMLGSKNKINNVQATIQALSSLKHRAPLVAKDTEKKAASK